MEKKTTRRIIGALVIVALVVILLPLFNGGETQSAIQTAELKAPPFPESSDNNTTVTDTVATSENNASSMRTWFQKMMAPQTAEPAAQSNQNADNTIATAQSTIQPTISDEPTNAQANAGNITPPKQDTLIANSAGDGEEDVEQGTMNNVIVQDTETTPNDGKASQVTANRPPVEAPTLSANLPASTSLKTPASSTAVQSSAAKPITSPIQTPANPIAALPAMQTEPVSKPAPATESATPTIPMQYAPVGAKEITSTPTANPQPVNNAVLSKTASSQPLAKTIAEVKKIAQNAHTSPVVTPDVEQLKKSAWVVQLGSFKSKINAENLTNALRAKGYKAFTYATKSNGQVRVYIGPEFKQSSATTVASRVQSDMKMHGIIVPYKPLEL